MSCDRIPCDDILELHSIFKIQFRGAYADLVSYLADKPQQVLIELENTLAHIMQSVDPDHNDNVRSENINKAKAHLLRATLDCYKLLWVELKREINHIYSDPDKLKFALNMSEGEFLSLRERFVKKANEARKKEIECVGISPTESLQLYAEAVHIGWNLVKAIDYRKVDDLKKFKNKYKFRLSLATLLFTIILSFAVGVVSSLIANGLYEKYNTNNIHTEEHIDTSFQNTEDAQK